MNFEDILPELKNGRKAKRLGFYKEYLFIFIRTAEQKRNIVIDSFDAVDSISKNSFLSLVGSIEKYDPSIYMVTKNGTVEYFLQLSDILADDWELIPNKNSQQK